MGFQCAFETTDCDYGWLNLLGHCYKFEPWVKLRLNSTISCAKEDAYVVAIETKEEIQEIIAAANNISNV